MTAPARPGLIDLMRLGTLALIPNLAQGPIIRRDRTVGLAARWDTNDWACRLFTRLRDRHGSGPLLVNVLGRRILVLLDPADARRVLAETSTSFTTASREKVAALSHFEPEAVLVTRGPERADRRRFNEQALDFPNPDHRLCQDFTTAVREEAAPLIEADELTWPRFHAAYQRIVRRVVLGDAARDDERITWLRDRLRSDGNWFMLHRKRHALRRELFARTRHYLELTEPGGLARAVAGTPHPANTDPVAQMQHWLFAYDAAPIAVFLALGLLVSHPDELARSRSDHDRLRACVRESLRLWPTTLAILRETTEDTWWPGDWTLPAGTAVVFYSSFFHRDTTHLAYADRFEPDVWLDGRATEDWSLAPFSRGPAECPGQHIVLSTAATLLAELLRQDWRLVPPHQFGPDRPLPRTADHATLRLARRQV